MPRKRTLNRKDYIGDFEEEETKKESEEAEDEDDAEEKDEDEEAEGDAEPDDEGGDDEEAPKKPAKKPPKKKKAATTTKRTRAPKIVRMKAVWIVYDNASKQIETFPFNQRAEADAFLEQKNTDKK